MLIATGEVCITDNVVDPVLRKNFKCTMVVNGVGYLSQLNGLQGPIIKGKTCSARFTIVGVEHALEDFTVPCSFRMMSAKEYGHGMIQALERLTIAQEDRKLVSAAKLEKAVHIAEGFGIPVEMVD